MREILSISVDDTNLIGTYHKPDEEDGRAKRYAASPGVLWLNSGAVRRCGAGDLGIVMAEMLRAKGYPVFRFDMPGLGDTPGDLPRFEETYWRFIEDGGHVRWTAQLISALHRQFNIPGFILGGHCGGATTAILVAEPQAKLLRGALLLEPAIRLTDLRHGEPMPGTKPPGLIGNACALTRSLVTSARMRSSQSVLLRPWRNGYHLLQRLSGRKQRDTSQPNLSPNLLRSWGKMMSMKLPTLVMIASDASRDVVPQALFRDDTPESMTLIDLPGTNHVLTTGNGIQRAVAEAESWLTSRFAPEHCSPSTLCL